MPALPPPNSIKALDDSLTFASREEKQKRADDSLEGLVADALLERQLLMDPSVTSFAALDNRMFTDWMKGKVHWIEETRAFRERGCEVNRAQSAQ